MYTISCVRVFPYYINIIVVVIIRIVQQPYTQWIGVMPERQLVAIFEMHEEYFRHVTVRIQVI